MARETCLQKYFNNGPVCYPQRSYYFGHSMHIFTDLLFDCYPYLQRILDAGLYNSIYYASCTLHYFRWRYFWGKISFISSALPDSPKREITFSENIYGLALEIDLSRINYYAFEFLAIQWFSHRNCDCDIQCSYFDLVAQYQYFPQWENHLHNSDESSGDCLGLYHQCHSF